jgi:hypothetical protein
MTTNERTITQAISSIEALDLEQIKLLLMDKKVGHGWTRTEADHYELEYKRFLTLLARFPGELLAPTKKTDQFWHGHILDTKKYAEDCNKVFGYFLHHFPYFGTRGEKDAENLAAAAVNMKRLYELEFGKEELADTSFCAAPETTAFCAAPEATAFCAAPDGKQSHKSFVNQRLDIYTRPVLFQGNSHLYAHTNAT